MISSSQYTNLLFILKNLGMKNLPVGRNCLDRPVIHQLFEDNKVIFVDNEIKAVKQYYITCKKKGNGRLCCRFLLLK